MAEEKSKQKQISKNIIDYVSSFYKSFEEEKVNEVDFAVFAKLSYFNFDVYLKSFKECITIGKMYDISKRDSFLKRLAYNADDLLLFNAITGNPRYKKVICASFVSSFSKENAEQFAAITFILPTKEKIVTYRGTDATLVGWKEDFDMAIRCPIPGQVSAYNYLIKVAKKYGKSKLYLCGHSKGGNLASYSYFAAPNKIAKKIEAVYSFDGPGFSEKLKTKLDVVHKYNKLVKYIPYQSIIGQIYSNADNKIVVASEGSLLAQHNLYKWHVDLDNNSFEKELKMSERVNNACQGFNKWLLTCKDDEIEFLVEKMYMIISDSDVDSAKDITDHKFSSLRRIMKTFKEENEDTKKKASELGKQILSNIWTYMRSDGTDDND